MCTAPTARRPLAPVPRQILNIRTDGRLAGVLEHAVGSFLAGELWLKKGERRPELGGCWDGLAPRTVALADLVDLPDGEPRHGAGTRHFCGFFWRFCAPKSTPGGPARGWAVPGNLTLAESFWHRKSAGGGCSWWTSHLMA